MGYFGMAGFKLFEWGTGNDRYTRTPSGFQIDPNFEWNKRSMEWEVIEGREHHLFDTTSALQIVFGRFAGMFANGRWVHKRNNRTVEGEIIQDSPLVHLLENPNPLQSGEEFQYEMALNYLLYGNNYSLPKYPSGFNDVPYIINNLPPNQMKIINTGKRWDASNIDDIVKEYRVRYSDAPDDVFTPSEVIHLRRSGSKSAIVGSSIMNSIHMEISNIRGAMGFRNVNITEHGALGIIGNKTHDIAGHKTLKEEDRKKIERQYTEKTHGIFDGMSRVRFIDGDVTYTATSNKISEQMLFEEISEDVKKIIDVVNLNDNIFSKEKSKVQANLDSGLRMGYQDAIFPFAGRVCSTLKRGMNLPSNEWLELDYSHLPCLQDDEAMKADVKLKKSQAFSLLVKNGIKEEEARIIVGI